MKDNAEVVFVVDSISIFSLLLSHLSGMSVSVLDRKVTSICINAFSVHSFIESEMTPNDSESSVTAFEYFGIWSYCSIARFSD